jgi:hypothetical protein
LYLPIPTPLQNKSPSRNHDRDNPKKPNENFLDGHLLWVCDIDLGVVAPYLWHPVIGHHLLIEDLRWSQKLKEAKRNNK